MRERLVGAARTQVRYTGVSLVPQIQRPPFVAGPGFAVNGNGEQPAASPLADEARPIRRWLQGYFRRRARPEDDVDDLVQDVFTRIVARNDGDRIANLGSYVMRTASSVLADRARRRGARRAEFHVSFDPAADGEDLLDPERIMAGKQDLNLAIAALLSLPEQTRTIFLLKRIEGYRHGEIAEYLGVSLSTVEKHMLKAIRHLGTELEKHDAA